ncbi:MAG: L-histidine N(alpha)-methyltransferase [Terriglobia bacterium]
MTAPADADASLTEFAAAVCAGLSKPQKEIPSSYLYDEIGSALFEVITLLPEYGLTRADARLLQRHSRGLAACLPSPLAVAELGSGTGTKTRWILSALAERQSIHYYPIDISPTALAICEHALGSIEGVRVVGLANSYLEGLQEAASRRQPGERFLVLFLGSTIGNFDRPVADKFLRHLRALLKPEDAFLLATDLEKSVTQLLPAYNDSLGVTAAFNLNLLARMNRELGADFDMETFRHEARYNQAERRIEMHLRSTMDQTVAIRRADLTVPFRRNETIWTENSHKFNNAEVIALGERAGFRHQIQWVDDEWPFAQTLFRLP